jgi:hypothetical protein
VLRSDDYLFGRVSLRNADDITSPALVDDSSDSSMKPFVRHPFVDARIYSDDNLSPGLIVIEKFAQPQLAMLSGLFCKEPTCPRTITLRLFHLQSPPLIFHDHVQNIKLQRFCLVPEQL